MDIKGIDVSSYEGKPDWKRVAKDGVKYAILRITQRYGIDTSFEHNYKGCIDNDIPVGVFKLPYALSVTDIKKDAYGVIDTLNGRKLDFPVFLDLEWDEQRENLTKNELSAMIKAFMEIIQAAGYKVGIYCNVDWYNNVIPDDCKGYDFWIANYPAKDDGTIHERLRPSLGVGWQYSEKGKVDGISGTVDMNVFYKDYTTTGAEVIHMISNCGSDENGGYKGGAAGDQTGTEWRLRTWYNRPWDCVLRHPDQKVQALLSELATKAAENDAVGYDQYQRTTYWTQLQKAGYDPAKITTKCEADCSSGIAANVKAAGYLLGMDKLKNVSKDLWTGNMKAALKAAGFEVLTASKYLTSADYLHPGDILLNEEHHVATNVTKGAKATMATTTTASTGKKTAPLTKSFAVILPQISVGCTGTAVKMLQAVLGVDIDGSFGNQTETALLTFQKNAGIDVDGVCGKDTWTKVAEHMRENTYN